MGTVPANYVLLWRSKRDAVSRGAIQIDQARHDYTTCSGMYIAL
jgi:hypothetical protein